MGLLFWDRRRLQTKNGSEKQEVCFIGDVGWLCVSSASLRDVGLCRSQTNLRNVIVGGFCLVVLTFLVVWSTRVSCLFCIQKRRQYLGSFVLLVTASQKQRAQKWRTVCRLWRAKVTNYSTPAWFSEEERNWRVAGRNDASPRKKTPSFSVPVPSRARIAGGDKGVTAANWWVWRSSMSRKKKKTHRTGVPANLFFFFRLFAKKSRI